MSREEIINKIKSILEELSYEDAVSYLTLNDITWLEENIKALEQKPVLDKLRAEIYDLAGCAYSDVCLSQRAFNNGLWKAVEVIDKYITEGDGA